MNNWLKDTFNHPKAHMPLSFSSSKRKMGNSNPSMTIDSSTSGPYATCTPYLSPGPQPAQDLSPYEGKQGLTTPNKSLKNVLTVKALLTHLLGAPPLSKEHGPHRCK